MDAVRALVAGRANVNLRRSNTPPFGLTALQLVRDRVTLCQTDEAANIVAFLLESRADPDSTWIGVTDMTFKRAVGWHTRLHVH